MNSMEKNFGFSPSETLDEFFWHYIKVNHLYLKYFTDALLILVMVFSLSL
jgi:hypothetical protein